MSESFCEFSTLLLRACLFDYLPTGRNNHVEHKQTYADRMFLCCSQRILLFIAIVHENLLGVIEYN